MADHDKLHPLRPFLKNWVWEHGRIGTRYLDCTDGEVKFDEGKKSHFASEAYLYVPLDKTVADDATVEGPPIQEAGLARFLKAAQLGKPEEAGSAAEVQRAVADCLSLGLFSAYQKTAREAFVRYSEEAMFDDEIRAAIVEEIRRGYSGMREQLALYDFTVLYGLPASLLIGDAPFIDWRLAISPGLPFVSLPLGPHCLLVGAASGRKSKTAPVVWKAAAAMGPLKDHNRLIVEQASLWLVATTDDPLVAVQSRFAKAEG
ncbi:hypothetical protein [Pandoraea norimbergensis]|uniref:DUF4238 domain-containing protein n=1 Tax=Pandoraea norimbergensis TaxID=93219 RepID=A0ABM5WIX5_9BURK|nr:hypothetical protein [Pandoraea norimbergensis]ALS60289.1 hypothetical protein AT302_11420 [Pandoraea norimbergensis]